MSTFQILLWIYLISAVLCYFMFDIPFLRRISPHPEYAEKSKIILMFFPVLNTVACVLFILGFLFQSSKKR